MKIKLITIAIIIYIISSCNNPQNKGQIKESAANEFNLHSDLFEFSSKMSSKDTIYIIANLSACKVLEFEKNTIIKNNDTVFISTENYLNVHREEENIRLEKKVYTINKNDSLNFESLFKYLSKKGRKNTQINTRFIQIIHKTDTIQYYSKGLGDQIPNSQYYRNIKQRIYPNEKIYLRFQKPVDMPAPPPIED